MDEDFAISLPSYLNNGFYTLRIRAVDDDGQKSFYTMVPFYKISVPGSNITAAEYFFGADPGGGNGFSVSGITAGETVDIIFQADISSLSNDIHTLRVRVKDDKGNWSIGDSRTFLKETVPGANITEAEYFIDSDPGEGQGVSIPFTPDATADVELTVPLTGLVQGIHHVSVRVKDNRGKWSLATVRTFLTTELEASKELVACEYFIDNDPGDGAATAIEIDSDTSVDKEITVDLTGLLPGIHHVGIRTQYANGLWSLTTVRTFLITEIAAGKEVVACEYFIDNDPGMGAATTIEIDSDTSVDKEITVDLTGLLPGIHHVGIRTQYANGLWSLTTVRTFLTTELAASKEVVACEYFIDNDPGMGAATAVAIDSGTSVDKEITVDLTGLLPGIHHVGIRTQYTNGLWSLTTVRTFLITEITSEREIVACEYFIDNDPGMGSATPVAITAGSSVEKNFVMDISAGMRTGFHKIGFRVQYDNGRWSGTTIRPFFKREVQPKTNIVSLDYTITGEESFSAGPFSYTSFTPDTSIDVHFSHDLSALEFGKSYTLHMTAAEANGLNSFQHNHDFTVTIDTEAPATPMDFTAVSGLGKVTLSWTANTEADLAKYKIYRGSSPSPTTVLTNINYPTAADTVFIDDTVVSGQTYYYRMTAEDYDYNASLYTDDVSVTPFWGPTWYVSTFGSDETGNGSSSKPFATIQNAIDKSFETNTIEVAAGTYTEDIDFGGKNLVLESADGAATTTIEGSGIKSVFLFTNGETATSLIKGFTITNGNAGSGGAVYCNNASSPRFEELIITGNSGTSGGAFYVRENSNISLENVVITDNTSSMGGGLYVYNSSVDLRNVVIGNHSGVSIASAIYLNGSHATIINSTIADNVASSQGAIYAVGSTINKIVNSIFWGNSPANIAFSGGGTASSVNVSYSDFENGEPGIVTNSNGTVTWGAGNLNADPVFISPAAGNFNIRNSSPCINTGISDTTGLHLSTTDAAGNPRIFDGIVDVIDMGAYELQGEPSMTYVAGAIAENTSWGSDTVKVIGDITVNDGITLTINPGVYVEFQGHYALNVLGRLLAVGTEENSITFTINDTTGLTNLNISDGGWYGLHIISPPIQNDSTIIEYCHFEYGKSTNLDALNAGGAIYINNCSKFRISHTIIKNCYSFGGGGLFTIYSNGEISDSEIIDNFSLYHGGGLYINSSNIKFYRNIVSGNTVFAGGQGGGLCITNNSEVIVNKSVIYNNSSNDFGGGIHFFNDASSRINNSTIFGNHSPNGGGVSYRNSTNEIRNCIIYNNYADEGNEVNTYSTDSDPNFYYCNIKMGETGFGGSGAGTNFTGVYENNIDADPLFVDATAGDFHLTAESPCIDAGDPALTDPDMTRSDIGAYYYDQSLVIALTLQNEGENHGDVAMDYEISGYTQNAGLRCFYKETAADVWQAATVTGDTAQIAPADYSGSIVWNSKVDIPSAELTDARFKVEPYGYGPVSTRADSLALLLDNYQDHLVSLSFAESLTEYSDTVAINYALTDPTGDSLTISLFYQIDESGWQNANLVEASEKYGAADYNDVIHWASATDLAGMDISQIRLAAVSADNWANGPGDTTVYIHLDNNAIPLATVDDPVGEQTGDVTLNYTLSDAESDTVQIAVYYAIDANFQNWHKATISGDTVIAAEAYDSSVTWNSAIDLAGLDTLVKLRIIPFDNDNGAAGVTAEFQVDNYQEQSVALSFAESLTEYSDTVAINYALTDPTGDSLTISLFYQIDESGWQSANLVEASEKYGAADYNGVIHWASATDLAGMDISQIRLAAVSADNWADGPGDTTIYIHLDNNAIPLATVDDPVGEQTGDVTLNYTLSDDESDTVQIAVYYAIDANFQNWHKATISGDTVIAAEAYDSSVTWNSAIDVAGLDLPVKLMLVPSDNDSGAAGVTAAFQVDNNQVPTVNLTEISEEQCGDITIEYTLSDPENDNAGIFCQFMTLNTKGWQNASVSADTSNLIPGVHQLIWKSANDIVSYVGQTRFRITPHDNDWGVADSIEITIDQIGAPRLISLNTPSMTEYTGDITVQYELADDEGDTIALAVEYSLDDGESWNSAGVTGNITEIDSSRYSGSFVWNSGTDAPGVDADSVIIRATPNDGNPGGQQMTEAFHLDNNMPPAVLSNLVYQEYSGNIAIPFVIDDAEGDTISLSLNYSTDKMTSWQQGTIIGLQRFADDAYQGSLSWNSEVDLPGIDHENTYIQIIPEDSDIGTADTVHIHLDNNAAPTIVIDHISTEQHNSVTVSYTASDAESDSLTLLPQYSKDGGSTWLDAGVIYSSPKALKSDAVSVTKGKSKSIKGSSTLIWNSALDIPGEDIAVLQFRIEVFDNDAGTSDMISFPLDNYQDHAVQMDEFDSEQSGMVRIDYTITDSSGDTIDVSFQYSLNNGNQWLTPTLLGNTLNITTYDNYISWNSVADANGIDHEAVWLRAIPDDGWAAGQGDTIIFHLDNNAPPTIVIDHISTEQHNDVTISYTASDAESDSLTLLPQYSKDGGSTWLDAGVVYSAPKSTKSDAVSTIRGKSKSIKGNSTLTWDSALDIPGEDVAVLQFRIEVSDIDDGTSDMISFPLDNYQDHAIQLDEFDSEQSGIVRIDYTITDSSGDTIDVSFQYSLNNGTQWLKPTLVGNTLNITNYDNYISWNSVSDANGIDNETVWLRAFPNDGWAEGQGDTVIFHLDNNAPPVAYLDFPAGEQHDSVFVSFSWEDEEDDAVSWEIYYSGDGVNWNSPSYTVLYESDEDNLVEFVWLTQNDLPGSDVGDIQLKVEVADTDPGEPSLQESIHIDNDQGRVTLAEISDEQSGDVPIFYEISESGNDMMTLQVLYKKPADSQWQTVTTSSQLTGIGSDKYSGSIIWQSGIDLANLDVPDVWIKVIPSDNWASGTSDSIQIHVDNEIGPMVVSYFPDGDLQERVHWGESISVIFDKPIQASSLTGNNISLLGTVSGDLAFTVYQDSATCVNIQPTGYYAALETLTVALKTGITDVSGIAIDGNKNGDPDGSPEDDFSFSFRTTALGDYDLDGEINLIDFSQFKDAWLSDPQDYSYELGPVTGSLPNFTLTPDDKYDLKDFMTLITMWNWSFDQIGDFFGSMSLAKSIRNEDSPVSLISNYERNGVWNATMLDGLSLDISNHKDQAVGGVEIYLKYDPSILQFQETRLVPCQSCKVG